MIRTDEDRELQRLRRKLYRTYWNEIPELGVWDTATLLDLNWLTTDVEAVDTHVTGNVFTRFDDAPPQIDQQIFGVTLTGFREALNVGEGERP